MVIEAFALARERATPDDPDMAHDSYRVAEIGALVGDPARACMLGELMSGRALTAGELAIAAGITPQTASAHLRKLQDARLIRGEKQGRHRYVTIASGDVAHLLETMFSIASGRREARAPSPRVPAAMKRARTCYDHLAGELGVALCDALQRRKWIALHDEAAEITRRGLEFCDEFGLQLEPAPRSQRPLCRTCLDWSERRPHLAGRFGAALATRMFDRKWLERVADGRALTITGAGKRGLRETFAIDF